ncbi:hypothetical protein LLEC1_05014 [Akanthomyces lecanii]|uniref:PWI domain-containing protein n=1 Tax=Cordyceps confragosa TaxID=2714763 RepID=A0A179IIE9_CORDF|nr:hypothetical protein LLEC1_05014 [Akanthomyces lecanii]
MASRTDARLLKTTKFPPEFSKKVDMQKVNLGVMKKLVHPQKTDQLAAWIASRISEILGNEDDVVIEMCFNLVEGPRYPDIKALQIQLTGFLDKETAPFCKELWKLFLSAQDSPQGVPKELLEAKKLELMQEKSTILENAVMNPTDGTAICLRRTPTKEETDRETEAISAKGAGMTVDLITAGGRDLHSDLDLPMLDAADPGLPTMAIATYHAREMDRNMDEDETADLGAPLPLPRPSDRGRHRAAAPDLRLRAEEEIRRATKTRNASDRGRADKIRRADLVAEVALHLRHLRPAVLEATPHRAAEALAGARAGAGAVAAVEVAAEAEALAEGVGARQNIRLRDDEVVADRQLAGATAPRHPHHLAVVDSPTAALHDRIWQKS